MKSEKASLSEVAVRKQYTRIIIGFEFSTSPVSMTKGKYFPFWLDRAEGADPYLCKADSQPAALCLTNDTPTVSDFTRFFRHKNQAFYKFRLQDPKFVVDSFMI